MIINIITTSFVSIIVAFVAGKIVKSIMNRKINDIQNQLSEANSKLKSAFVKFGKTFEHFAPFTKIFPGDKGKFIFLGQPIDGIIFDEKNIKFIEIKTGCANLSPKQRKIKSQVETGKIKFIELRY